MPKSGPIIIVEDDHDDQELLREIFQELIIPNAVRFFATCLEVLDYLMTTLEKPLLIISDINLPIMSGLQLKQQINEHTHLSVKNIPFIFLTTNPDSKTVVQAYQLMAQGYFVKPNSLQGIRDMIKMIVDYWSMSRHPNGG